MMDLADWHEWWKHFGSTELRHILLLWWDPIGVYGVVEAIDEYDDYSGQLARMLREGVRAAEIAEFLGRIRCDWMGLSPIARADAFAAERIVEWFDRAMSRAG
ncbi:MAG TPA: hypothetical protein VIJ51_02415 [Solirubrobacteraceae bacterium]